LCRLNDGGAAEVAAALVAAARSPGGARAGVTRSGSTRLRDAIVWGYMMQRHDEQKKVAPGVIIGSAFYTLFPILAGKRHLLDNTHGCEYYFSYAVSPNL
jgi:hypothetical protein